MRRLFLAGLAVATLGLWGCGDDGSDETSTGEDIGARFMFTEDEHSIPAGFLDWIDGKLNIETDGSGRGFALVITIDDVVEIESTAISVGEGDGLVATADIRVDGRHQLVWYASPPATTAELDLSVHYFDYSPTDSERAALFESASVQLLPLRAPTDADLTAEPWYESCYGEREKIEFRSDQTIVVDGSGDGGSRWELAGDELRVNSEFGTRTERAAIVEMDEVGPLLLLYEKPIRDGEASAYSARADVTIDCLA